MQHQIIEDNPYWFVFKFEPEKYVTYCLLFVDDLYYSN